ncbi:eukaryotic-like serine/threonine-protein kinase [Microdochium nivale]|nr:eukaryotic-like serine/threonine-protein kinase [Microdochium nivale]
MELIPYESREGRQIVLRHRNALVVRDQGSHRLQVRGLALTECPTCRRPLRSASPERHFDGPRANPQHDSYVDPEYFRMLQAGYTVDIDDHPPPPASPVRRLTQPALPSDISSSVSSVNSSTGTGAIDDAEFVSSSPAPQEGARIRRDAFSPNYFKRFFVEEQELGRGGKGVVLLVRHEIDGCQLGHFACKRVPVGDDHAWLEKVLIEVELLAKLSHPNLVSYRHVWLEDMTLSRFGPSVACAFILQQYCNAGDLLKYIVGEQPKLSTKEQLKAQLRRRSKGAAERTTDPMLPSLRKLGFDEIFSLFKDIVSGLTYLHGANYVHRDLKPSNCLLHLENGKLTCLISDFGEVQPSGAIRKSTGTTGTISYCAPEVLQPGGANGRLGDFTAKSDVFSLGMILYFLCFGHLPYSHANTIDEELEDVDLLRAEIRGWRGFQQDGGIRQRRSDLPAQLYTLLKQMLSIDPASRPTAADVLAAMNHESSGFYSVGAGPGRSASPVADLHHRRVQSLDSPMPSGTPVPDPSKQRGRRPVDPGGGGGTSASLSPDPFADASSSLSMAISRSQDSRFRRGSTAPPAGINTNNYNSQSSTNNNNDLIHHHRPSQASPISPSASLTSPALPAAHAAAPTAVHELGHPEAAYALRIPRQRGPAAPGRPAVALPAQGRNAFARAVLSLRAVARGQRAPAGLRGGGPGAALVSRIAAAAGAVLILGGDFPRRWRRRRRRQREQCRRTRRIAAGTLRRQRRTVGLERLVLAAGRAFRHAVGRGQVRRALRGDGGGGLGLVNR